MSYPSLSWLLAPNGEVYLDESRLGAPSGIAELDANGKLSTNDLITSIISVSGGKTLAISDAGTIQRCTNSSAITITVPSNSSVSFPTGTRIEIYQAQSGTVTIAAQSGVTLESASSSNMLAGQYSMACLIKMGTNIWALTGDVKKPLYPSAGG